MILIEKRRIYILNTTRFYHEDFEEYPGAWFSCPVDFEEVKERLGVQSEEEIEIEDYELPFPLEGNTRLWEIRINGGKMQLYIRFIRKAFKIRMEMESVIFQELSADWII